MQPEAIVSRRVINSLQYYHLQCVQVSRLNTQDFKPVSQIPNALCMLCGEMLDEPGSAEWRQEQSAWQQRAKDE